MAGIGDVVPEFDGKEQVDGVRRRGSGAALGMTAWLLHSIETTIKTNGPRGRFPRAVAFSAGVPSLLRLGGAMTRVKPHEPDREFVGWRSGMNGTLGASQRPQRLLRSTPQSVRASRFAIPRPAGSRGCNRRTGAPQSHKGLGIKQMSATPPSVRRWIVSSGSGLVSSGVMGKG